VAKSSSGPAIAILLIVGVFVAIAVLGIIAAIAIPNLLTATQRAKQKRTMADMRSLATALEAYSTDKNAYPPGSVVSDIAGQIEPTYIRTAPRLDGWQTPFRYQCWQEDSRSAGCDQYAIASAGKDQKFEYEDLRQVPPASPGSGAFYDRDIVYRSGAFIQYPE